MNAELTQLKADIIGHFTSKTDDCCPLCDAMFDALIGAARNEGDPTLTERIVKLEQDIESKDKMIEWQRKEIGRRNTTLHGMGAMKMLARKHLALASEALDMVSHAITDDADESGDDRFIFLA